MQIYAKKRGQKIGANKDQKSVFESGRVPVVFWHWIKQLLWKALNTMEQLTHTLSPAGHSPDVRGIPRLPVVSLMPDIGVSCECSSGSLSLTRVWPCTGFPHFAGSHKGYQTSAVSQIRLIQQRRHRVASQKTSPSGGWLSGRMWADSCSEDWRNKRWSRLADHRYLPCHLRQREGSLI